jgi:hypothetical protein
VAKGADRAIDVNMSSAAPGIAPWALLATAAGKNMWSAAGRQKTERGA